MTDDTTARTSPWQRVKPLLPYFVTIALFAAGAWALHHLLAPVDLRSVMAQARATPAHILLLAVLTTAASYMTLIGYDWSALRYIGKRLPLPVTMLGAFLGYAFGNTIGAGPITGGAVRYRIYSALGLSAYDIAAIATFGASAFGFGATIIGFGALVIHPHALGHLLHLDPATIRYGSLAIVATACAILFAIAARQSEITVRGIALRPPTPGIMAAQFVFTAVDLLLAAATLYLLLPPSDLGFPTFLAVFAAAIMAGVVSHVPGGVGVFETVIIAALPPSVPVEQAATGLLLYRLVYYLLPFFVALVILAVTEFRHASGRSLPPFVQALVRSISALVPLAIATMILTSGVIMIISSLIPPTSEIAEDLELLLPTAILEGGALLTSAIGASMLVIAHGLLRRVQGAWWLAVLALSGGIATSLANGLDYERALMLGAALLILLPTKAEFFRTTRMTRDVFSLRWTLMMLGLLGGLLVVLVFAQKATPYAHDLWWQFASDQSAPRALRAALLGGILLTVALLVFALRPGTLRHAPATPEDLERARALIAAQPDPGANIALTGDKCLMFSDSGRAALMYRIQNRSWIALHEPFGDPAEARQLAWAFHDAAYAANARPIFYAVSAAHASLWIDMGLALIKMGEEAVVPLAGFSLDGPARKRLRTTHNRALRDGLTFEMLEAPVAPETLEALRPISDAWLAAKSGGEKGFSLGTFDPAVLSRAPIAVVRHHDRIVGFATLWLTDAHHAASIDLMRHADDAPSGMMEFLFTELLLHFAGRGYAEFSLGNAPLSGIEARRGARLTARMGAFVYKHGRQFYNFEGLRAFKQKFDPEWRPVYVAVPPRANILAVATDIVTLINGGLPRPGRARKPRTKAERRTS
ncbi:bifunctional lysylphosphatidylglycerol flippase/synthetase MprF [Sagittula salina]|uniref:Phosphatidylglycerol lysyltransferase n=1 Tax=Sagittula salina TaxID=2820268 RepID=A0A940S063_9RHOB|nr:bifunctional lysylphosphatidylglycerol flippase/synthetase MprF [Sagittula salina]MBP0482718.1 bifunctional lysylphosphatidylglycerol flippase/synthetase MprF [Sagittula salina]